MASRAVTDFPLKDKIAVVTGGGSGINLSFVRLAQAKGARVIIADLRLTKEAEDFLAGAKETVIFQHCDVVKRADLENLITVSQKHFGDVPDVYIAGAGVFEPEWSNFWSDTEEDGYAQLEINTAHPIKLTRIALRALAGKDKPGVVLIVASIVGLLPSYSVPLYSATKHALVGFTRGMSYADRLEGVRIIAICPSTVMTPLWTSRPELISQYGLVEQVCQTPSDVATEMVALVEDGTKYPGGTILETTLGGTHVVPPPEGYELLKAAIERTSWIPGEALKGKGERGGL
ncbi:MAG: hypothetical protein M1839_007387 [Geoglossum umbratile]|nr:MAG: hypothetical protein M1839_007387 [Geoglossum umbratile]